jgi:hypothetical protein
LVVPKRTSCIYDEFIPRRYRHRGQGVDQGRIGLIGGRNKRGFPGSRDQPIVECTIDGHRDAVPDLLLREAGATGIQPLEEFEFRGSVTLSLENLDPDPRALDLDLQHLSDTITGVLGRFIPALAVEAWKKLRPIEDQRAEHLGAFALELTGELEYRGKTLKAVYQFPNAVFVLVDKYRRERDAKYY